MRRRFNQFSYKCIFLQNCDYISSAVGTFLQGLLRGKVPELSLGSVLLLNFCRPPLVLVPSRASNERSRRFHNHGDGPSPGWKHLLVLTFNTLLSEPVKKSLENSTLGSYPHRSPWFWNLWEPSFEAVVASASPQLRQPASCVGVSESSVLCQPGPGQESLLLFQNSEHYTTSPGPGPGAVTLPEESIRPRTMVRWGATLCHKVRVHHCYEEKTVCVHSFPLLQLLENSMQMSKLPLASNMTNCSE